MAENSFSSLPSKLPATGTDSPSSSVNVCVLVNNIPMCYESSDVAKCLAVSLPLTSPLTTSDVTVVPTQSGGNTSPPSTKHAVLAINPSNVEGKSILQFSFPICNKTN